MEEILSEEPNRTEFLTNYEQIDLTLKLSPYGSAQVESEKGLMRFGDLQAMRRVRSGKRLVLEKQRRENELKMAWHKGGDGSNIQTSPKQENYSMTTPKAMLQEMTVKSSESQFECPAKRLKHVNPSLKDDDDVMDILRQMPSVATTGDDGPNGKRIEGLLHKNKGGQVCIVCVCHGSFLSPTEFVMHAGGKEVANPMEHITVCSDFKKGEFGFISTLVE